MTVHPLEYNVWMKYVNNECGRMEKKNMVVCDMSLPKFYFRTVGLRK